MITRFPPADFAYATLIAMVNLFFFILMICLFACEEKKDVTKINHNTNQSKSLIKYAQGFDLQIYKGYKILIIKHSNKVLDS